jgi:hypothetical protein
MPQPRVLDLTPPPRTEETGFEKFLGGAVEKYKKNMAEKEESDALKDIYSKYQNEGKNIEEAIMDIQTRPGISPTARVNQTNTLLELRKQNATMQEHYAKHQKEQNQQELNKKIIEDIEDRRGLERGALSPYINEPRMAEQVTRPPKETKLPISERPIDPDQLKKIQKVRADPEYAKASPSRKYEMLTNGDVSRANAEAESKIHAAEAEANEKARKYTRAEEVEFHKESADYDNDLNKQTKVAKNQLDVVKNIEKALKSGNVKPSSLANIFKGFGTVGDKISNALLNDDQATLIASIPTLLEGWKEVFGVRLSDADLRVLQDKLPDIGKQPEANNAIIKIIKKYADQTLLRSKIGQQIKAENKGLRPLNYAAQIEDRFDDMVTPVKIINPDTGNVIEIPTYKLSAALDKGARLVQEE